METTARFFQVDHPAHVERVHAAAARAIPGYGGAGFSGVEYQRDKQARLADLFAGHGPAPDAVTIVAATDERAADVLGAVVVETPFYGEFATTDPDRARALARSHRTLAAIFVDDQHRGAGLGRRLLIEFAAYNLTLHAGARYLDGFVDDRADSVDFYRSVGATVTGHNAGLPARRPTNTPMNHNPQVNGHWFYLDAWPLFEGPMLLCNRCQNQLTFDPRDGGDLVCATCGPPPGR